MLRFKRFRSATITISGIELMRRIRKGQFDLSAPGLTDTAAPIVWKAILLNKLGILIYWKCLETISYLN